MFLVSSWFVRRSKLRLTGTRQGKSISVEISIAHNVHITIQHDTNLVVGLAKDSRKEGSLTVTPGEHFLADSKVRVGLALLFLAVLTKELSNNELKNDRKNMKLPRASQRRLQGRQHQRMKLSSRCECPLKKIVLKGSRWNEQKRETVGGTGNV